MTAETILSKHVCSDCRQPIVREGRGRRPSVCDDCKALKRAKYKQEAARKFQENEAATKASVAGQLVEIRQRFECTKPLLRLALERGSWDLVAAALEELEMDDVDWVRDMRATAGVA